MTVTIPRRTFLAGSASLVGLAAAGCTSGPAPRTGGPGPASGPPSAAEYRRIYGPVSGEPYALPAVELSRVPQRFWRQQVNYPTRESAGTLVIDTSRFYLYLVEGGGRAMRYGVGLGRAGFAWSGRANIESKQEWPRWFPPSEMIARQPELAKYSEKNGGMPPGPSNPLGARALYIYQNGEDTLYRVHGSPEYWSIGKAVSSGCVRLMNQDIIDLYRRVNVGAPIVVS